MDPYVYLLVVAATMTPPGLFVWYMAHRQRLEDEAAEAPDVSAE
jgi:hypothetical protein